MHVKMYQIGDKFCLSGLKSLAARKFETACDKFWDKDAFAEAAHYICSTEMPDERMKDKVIGVICQHFDLVQKPAIEELLKQFDLSFDVLKLKSSKIMVPKRMSSKKADAWSETVVNWDHRGSWGSWGGFDGWQVQTSYDV